MNAGTSQRTLGEIFHFKNGRGFKKTEWGNEGLPIIRIQNLNDDTAEFNYFNGTYEADILVQENDLLFSWSGTVGSSFGPHIWTRQDGLLNQHIFKIGFKTDIEPLYAYFALEFLTEEIERSVNGAVGLVHITKEKLNQFKIPVPTKVQQQRIVAILDEAFANIATAKTNTEKNLQNAKGAFFSYLYSLFATPERGWIQKSLIDLCDPKRGITYGVIKLGDEVPSGTPCLRTSNVRWLRIETDGMKRIAPALSAEYSRTILRGGELLVNVRGTLGGVAVAPQEMAGWNVSREVAVVPADARLINPRFLCYLIGSGTSQDWLGEVKKGAAYVGINLEDLRLLPVTVPPIAKQLEIVQFLEALQEETISLETIYRQKLAALDELKQSLLLRAFNGDL